MWSRLQLTGAISLALLVSALFSPVFGRFIDSGYGARLLPAGASLGGISLFLVSYVFEIWQFYLLWGIIGCCFAACLYEPCFALLTRSYGGNAKRAIIFVTLVAGFAGSISFPLSHFIASLWDWQMVTRVFSVVTIFVAAPLLYLGAVSVEGEYQPLSQVETLSNAQHKPEYQSVVFIRLAISFALLALVHGVTLHHLLPVLNDRGVLAGASVFVASLVGPMQVLGRVVISMLQKQLTHKMIVCSAFVFMACSMIFLFNSRLGLPVAVTFAVVFGCGYGTLSIIRPVIARDILGEGNFGAKSGQLAFFYLIGAAAAPYLGSLVWAAAGYDALIILLFALTVIGLWLIKEVLPTST